MKNTLLKTALVPLILIIALAVFGYIYIHNNIKDNINNSIEARAKIISLNEEELSLKILKNGTDSSLEKRQSVLKYFVPEDDLVSFIEKLESTASVLGLNIEVGSLKSEKGMATEKGVGRLSLNIMISGKWQNLMHYISLLEIMPYKINISKVEISRGGDLPKNSKIKVSTVPDWKAGIAIDILTLNSNYEIIK